MWKQVTGLLMTSKLITVIGTKSLPALNIAWYQGLAIKTECVAIPL